MSFLLRLYGEKVPSLLWGEVVASSSGLAKPTLERNNPTRLFLLLTSQPKHLALIWARTIALDLRLKKY